MVPGSSQDGIEKSTDGAQTQNQWLPFTFLRQVWKHIPSLGVSKCSSNQTFTVSTFVKLGHNWFRNSFPCASLGTCGHLQQQMLISHRIPGGSGRCICPTCLEFSHFIPATVPLLLASNISRMQEEQIPHRQNLTHCCVLIAMFDVSFFSYRFPNNLLFTSASGELWKMVRIGGQPLGFGK